MRLIWVQFVVCVSLVFFSLDGHTESGGGEAKSETADAGTMNKEKKAFTEKSSKLKVLEVRIQEAEKRFRELIQQKAAAETMEEKQALIREMVEVAKARNEAVDSYEKVRTQLLYRFPDEGEAVKRRYGTQSKRSAEEMEGVATLDEMLTRIKKAVLKKYGPLIQDEAEPKMNTAKSPAMVKKEEEPKRLRLEK